MPRQAGDLRRWRVLGPGQGRRSATTPPGTRASPSRADQAIALPPACIHGRRGWRGGFKKLIENRPRYDAHTGRPCSRQDSAMEPECR